MGSKTSNVKAPSKGDENTKPTDCIDNSRKNNAITECDKSKTSMLKRPVKAMKIQSQRIVLIIPVTITQLLSVIRVKRAMLKRPVKAMKIQSQRIVLIIPVKI